MNSTLNVPDHAKEEDSKSSFYTDDSTKRSLTPPVLDTAKSDEIHSSSSSSSSSSISSSTQQQQQLIKRNITSQSSENQDDLQALPTPVTQEADQPPKPTRLKLDYLEGLRGIAAWHVTCAHQLGFWNGFRALTMYYEGWSFA
jgi:hypothetical protein